MAEKSGFFNARETETGTYDREYDAEQFAGYFANFISNGVYANPANQLKVVFDDLPNKPFVVIVRKGKAYIDGYWYELTEDMEITIPVNTKAYIVKDVIRCTLDKAERKVSIVLEEDVTSDRPTNNNNRHDLVLSTIIVQPNASKLNAKDITDRRPDKTYCGFVTGVIDQIDTTELFQQYDETFKTWFDEMKGQLSTDAAGNLQTQIGLLSNLKTKVKDSIVNAINSLYDSTIGKTLKTLDEVSSNTEQGFYVDALAIAELNKNSIKEIITTDNGTAIKYANGYVKQFGQKYCPNANGYVRQQTFTLPVPIDLNKDYSLMATKKSMDNSYNGIGVVAFCEIASNGTSGSKITVGLQSQIDYLAGETTKNSTLSWSVEGFCK